MTLTPDQLVALTQRLEDHLASVQESGITHLPAAGVERKPAPKTPAPAPAPASAPRNAPAPTPSAPRNPAPAAPAQEGSTLWMQPARRRPGLDSENTAAKTVVVVSDQDSLAPDALALLDKMLGAIGFLRVGQQQPWDLAEARNDAPVALLVMGDAALREVTGQSSWSVSMYGGKWNSVDEVPLMPTFSAVRLLDSQNYKRQAWKDLQAVLERLQLPLPT